MTESHKITSNSSSMLLKPFVEFDKLKQKMIQTMVIALFGNTLWNALGSQRTTQGMINLGGATTLLISRNGDNIPFNRQFSKNVCSLETGVTTFQETVQNQKEEVKKMSSLNTNLTKTSNDFQNTSEILQKISLENQKILEELKIIAQNYKSQLESLEANIEKLALSSSSN